MRPSVNVQRSSARQLPGPPGPSPIQSHPASFFFLDEESFEWTRNGWMGPWNPRPYPTLPTPWT
ncbi:unnamed protein product [Fusarium graminearum]|nr:unnamed protein product [Fusarium graminearum]CAG1972298.1 unnamed protein product [Fusarium graminearum]